MTLPKVPARHTMLATQDSVNKTCSPSIPKRTMVEPTSSEERFVLPGFFSDDEERDMDIVLQVLRENGIEARFEEFTEPEELRGQCGLTVTTESQVDEAGRILEVFYEERSTIAQKEEPRSFWQALFHTILEVIVITVALMILCKSVGSDVEASFALPLMLIILPIWILLRNAVKVVFRKRR